MHRLTKDRDVRALKRAMELHEKAMRDDPEYRERWERLTAEMFTTLADAKPIEDR